MQKEQRQSRILELIRTQRIKKQEVLADLLIEAGFQVTQSSVSRDLIELGILKIDGHYAIPSPTLTSLGVGPLDLTPAGDNLIVAKTETGMASAVCVRLDNAQIQGIVGTIAGEDTIFIAVADRAAQRDVMKTMAKFFEA